MGRSSLEQAAHHELTEVRLLAAAECLPFAPEVAEPVLAEIAGGADLHSLTAGQTLKSFRSGTLNMKW